MRLPLWVTGRSVESHMPAKRISSAAALFVALTLVFASAAPALAAVPDSQQQLTTFDPAVNVDECAGTSVNTHPGTGKTLLAFIQPDADATHDGMLVVGLLNASGALDGSLVEVSITLPAYGPSNCAPPSLAAGPDGTWLVVWPLNTEVVGAGIFGQIISATGGLVGANFYISDDNYEDIETVSAAWSATDARYLVTWKADVSQRVTDFGELSAQQVVGQFVNGTGSLIGSNFLVTNFALGVDNNQDLAFGNGIWIAVFSEDRDTPKGQIITTAGLQGAAFELSSDAQNYRGPGIVYNPATEQFLATFWERNGEYTKHLRLLSGSGTPLGSDTVYVATGTRPRIGVAGAGGYVMTWNNNSGGHKIAAQAFGATLQVVGEQYQVSSDALSAFRPELACTGAGFVFTYWGLVSGVSNIYSNLVAGDCDYALPATNRDGSVWTTALVILAGLTAAASIVLRVRGAKRA
jgi:hypothetical protein